MSQAPLPRLSVRRGLASADVLQEGVPDHLRPALARWTRYWLGAEPEFGADYESDEIMRLFSNKPAERERRLGDVLAAAHVRVMQGEKTWRFNDAALMIDDPGVAWDAYDRDDDFLDLVDMHLQLHGGGAEKLAEILETGGSAWTVAKDPVPHLERRVPDEEQNAYLAATTPADDASAQLQEAWGKVYGRTPDPSDAWDHAIKAVEILLHPIVAPNSGQPTLGTMLRDLKAKPEKWILPLASSSKKVGGVEALTAMLGLMWPNPDRHGSGSGASRVPTQEEAEQVVRLAVFVVGWLRVDALRADGVTAARATGSP